MRACRFRGCQRLHAKAEGYCMLGKHGTSVNHASICARCVVVSCTYSCEKNVRNPVRDHGGMVEIVPSDPESSMGQSSQGESQQNGLLETGGVRERTQRSDRGRKPTRRGNGRGWLWAGDSAYDKGDRKSSHNHVGV